LSLAFFLESAAITPGAEAPAPSGGESSWSRAIQQNEEAARSLEREKESAVAGWGISEMLGLFALILAAFLMFRAFRWTRGLGAGKGGGREMRLLDRMAVGRQSALLLVRLRDRDYWLAEGANGVSLLADLGPVKLNPKAPDVPISSPRIESGEKTPDRNTETAVSDFGNPDGLHTRDS
jgi:flagellar biogenesis protein FliO